MAKANDVVQTLISNALLRSAEAWQFSQNSLVFKSSKLLSSKTGKRIKELLPLMGCTNAVWFLNCLAAAHSFELCLNCDVSQP